MADDANAQVPQPPKPPPKLHPAFLLVWLLAIGAFVVLAGCTVMLLFVGLEGGSGAPLFFGLLVMGLALFGFVKALTRARRAELDREPPNKVLLYVLLMPILAALLWGAGCLLSIAGM